MREGTSNASIVEHGFGGVARNVAENLARLSVAVDLCSVVGDDEDGRALLAQLRESGVDIAGIAVSRNVATPQYAAIVAPGGELFAGAADVRAVDALTVEDLERWWPQIDSAAWLFIDCNLSPPVIAACIARRSFARWRLAIDGTSVAKVQRLPRDLSGVDLLFLNEDEFRALGHPNAGIAAISRGAAGLLLVTDAGRREFPAFSAKPVNASGAGDALAGGTLYGMLSGKAIESAVELGLALAALTVESAESVRQDLSEAMLASVPRLRSLRALRSE